MSRFFDDSLARHLEEMQRITQPLRDIQLVSEKFKEMTGAARLAEELAQVHHSLPSDEMQKFSTASMLGVAAQGMPLPGTLASMGVLELEASLAGSVVLEHAAPKASFLNFREEIESSGRLWRDQCKALDLYSTSRQIQEMLAGSQITSGAFGPHSFIDRYTDALRDLQKHVASFSHVDLVNSFHKSLQESVSSSLAALRDGIIGPASGLMIADPLERQGIFTWAEPRKMDPIFGSAALFPAPPSLQQLPPSSRKLLIECHIDCSICGDSMLVEGEERYWDSPGKLRISLRIFPLCSACTRRAQGSPDYWDEHLARLLEEPRPSLRLIRGKGKVGTEPKRRDHLRLVKSEEDDD